LTPGLLAAGLLAASGALTADVPEQILTKVAAAKPDAPERILDAIRDAEPYESHVAGLRVVTDLRWFRVDSVDGPGAPLLELRRWPGDTVVAFYVLPAEATPAERFPGLVVQGASTPAGACSVQDGRLESKPSARSVVWAECRRGSRRIGAIGIPGDAGFGASGKPDMRLEILGVLRHVEVEERGPDAAPTSALPELPVPPTAADERRDAWQVFQGDGFTLGLPPGMRAIRVSPEADAPRPLGHAVAWMRGRFLDRDGAPIAVGDGRRVGYVAYVEGSNEEWRAGVAAPLGARRAERLDEARLDDIVHEWTGATRAVVSHWKEPGFAGDWLVFRLHLRTAGVEIGLPVLSGWRSLALFWIPVTWRDEGKSPAPPPIDPAERLGVRFDRLRPGERARQALVEGTLVVGSLRLEIPRGYWPVANLGSNDGLPVTVFDPTGALAGRIEGIPADRVGAAVSGEGWTALPRPSSRKAAAIHLKDDGTCVVVAKTGDAYRLVPEPGGKERAGAWRRLVESASIVKPARISEAPERDP
jgi:hypothetical protein